MNFCAALYTQSFLYILFARCFWLRLHCKKQRPETSTPILRCLPFPLFLLSFPLFPLHPCLYSLSVLSSSLLSSQLSSWLIAPLILSFFRRFILLFVFSFSRSLYLYRRIRSCRAWGKPHKPCGIHHCHCAVFAVYKRLFEFLQEQTFGGIGLDLIAKWELSFRCDGRAWGGVGRRSTVSGFC
jgi:hypothetical protein